MDQIFSRILLEQNLDSVQWQLFSHLAATATASDSQLVTLQRKAGKLASDDSPESLCNKYNLPEETVIKVLKYFESRGWLQRSGNVMILGELVEGKKKWLCANSLNGTPKIRKEVKESGVDMIRRMVEEKRKATPLLKLKKMSAESKRHILQTITKGKGASPASRVLNLLKDTYFKKFGKSYPMATDNVSGHLSAQKEFALINRALLYCGNEEIKLQEIIEWVINNWVKVKGRLGYLGVPNMSLFSTASLFKVIVKLYAEDYADGLLVTDTGHRYSEKAAEQSPELGWGVE